MPNALEILLTIADIQFVVLFFCCLIVFIFNSKLNQPFKILGYYLLALLIIGYVSKDLGKAPYVNNLHLLHLLAIIEFISLSLFFKEILNFSVPKVDLYYKIYLAIIGGIVISNSIWIENLRVFNTNGKILVQFVIIILCVIFFYQRAQNVSKINVYEKALRLTNSAMLIYYSGSFIYFLIYKFTANNKQFLSTEILIFNASLYLLFTILILIAILMVVTQRKKTEIP